MPEDPEDALCTIITSLVTFITHSQYFYDCAAKIVDCVGPRSATDCAVVFIAVAPQLKINMQNN